RNADRWCRARHRTARDSRRDRVPSREATPVDARDRSDARGSEFARRHARELSVQPAVGARDRARRGSLVCARALRLPAAGDRHRLDSPGPPTGTRPYRGAGAVMRWGGRTIHRVIASLAGVMVGALALTACAGTQEDAPNPQTPGQDPLQVVT